MFFAQPVKYNLCRNSGVARKSSQTALELIHKYDNVLVVQTYSKSRSLAGMRIGHAFGSEELIAAMSDVRFSFNSYPMTRLSVEIGAAAIKDVEYFEQTKRQVIATREWVKSKIFHHITPDILLLLLLSLPKNASSPPQSL